MDLRAQAITLWLRRWWILGGALIAAVVVWAVTTFLVTPVYASSLTSRVVETGGTDSSTGADTATYYAETVAGLASTEGTLTDIAQRSGQSLTKDEVSARITVAATSTPGFVSVTARASTPDDAAHLADATAAALAARVDRDNAAALAGGGDPLRAQLAQINGQLSGLPSDAPQRAVLQQQADGLVSALTSLQTGKEPQLLVGAQATVPTTPESPIPWRDAAMAFLIALVVLAEGVVIWRAVRGRIVERDPASAVERITGLPTVEIEARDTAHALLAPLYHDHLAAADLVTVVQLGSPRDLDVGRVLEVAGGLSRPSDADGPAAPVRTLRRAGVDQAALEALHRDGGVAVLAVDTARASRRSLRTSLAALTAIGVDVRAVIVWRGRFPRGAGAEPTAAPALAPAAAPAAAPPATPAPEPVAGPAAGPAVAGAARPEPFMFSTGQPPRPTNGHGPHSRVPNGHPAAPSGAHGALGHGPFGYPPPPHRPFVGPTPNGPNGQPSNGQPSNGQPSNGQPSNGQPSNGQSANGHVSNGHAARPSAPTAPPPPGNTTNGTTAHGSASNGSAVDGSTASESTSDGRPSTDVAARPEALAGPVSANGSDGRRPYVELASSSAAPARSPSNADAGPATSWFDPSGWPGDETLPEQPWADGQVPWRVDVQR